MKTANTIKNRQSEVNNNKVLFQVYGMDENGTNFIYETAEYDVYEEALSCYNSIKLQENGEEKILEMILVDEEDTIIFNKILLKFTFSIA